MGLDSNGSKHRIFRPGAKATSRGQFDKVFDRAKREDPYVRDALLLGEVHYGKRAAEDRLRREVREETARRAAMAVAPKGATHRILDGDFADQWVTVLDFSDFRVRVSFIGGPRNGAVMFLEPSQLAKPGVDTYDVELEAKVDQGGRAPRKMGRVRTDY